jgi:hypothetical protein
LLGDSPFLLQSAGNPIQELLERAGQKVALCQVSSVVSVARGIKSRSRIARV